MSYLGQAWNQGMFGWTLGNTLLAPNPPYPNCRMCGWDGDWDCPGIYGMSSYHPEAATSPSRWLRPIPEIVNLQPGRLGPRLT